eukprot:3822913-Rhodomonas_salina.3
MPVFGSIVQKGKFAASAEAFCRSALNKVDFPTANPHNTITPGRWNPPFGSPTIPVCSFAVHPVTLVDRRDCSEISWLGTEKPDTKEDLANTAGRASADARGAAQPPVCHKPAITTNAESTGEGSCGPANSPRERPAPRSTVGEYAQDATKTGEEKSASATRRGLAFVTMALVIARNWGRGKTRGTALQIRLMRNGKSGHGKWLRELDKDDRSPIVEQNNITRLLRTGC